MPYAGGLTIETIDHKNCFVRDYKKLSNSYKDLADNKLKDLLKNPMPRGLRFEKLQGHSHPDIYTIHLDGNYKISFEVNGSHATLRRVGTHNKIDRTP